MAVELQEKTEILLTLWVKFKQPEGHCVPALHGG